MLRRFLVIQFFFVIAVWSATARAQTDGIWLQPLMPYWGWGTSVERGKIANIVEKSQVDPSGSGKLSNGFDHEFDFNYQANRLITKSDGYVHGQSPFYVASFDAKGRRVKVTYSSTQDRVPNVASIETVRYDANGKLTGLFVSRSTGDKTDVAVETAPAGDGGSTLSWKYPTPRQTEYFGVTFDKSGKLIREVLSFNETKISDTTYTYNEHGDVQSSKADERGRKTSSTFEYDYDSQGNWTKKTENCESVERGAAKKWVGALCTRTITYQDKSFRPEGSATVTKSDDANKLPGSYYAEFGDPTHVKFYCITLMQLGDGGEMTMVSTMPDIRNPGQCIHNWENGKWILSGDSIRITVEMHNGKPVATDDPKQNMKMTVKDAGKRLVPDDGPEFKRDE